MDQGGIMSILRAIRPPWSSQHFLRRSDAVPARLNVPSLIVSGILMFFTFKIATVMTQGFLTACYQNPG